MPSLKICLLGSPQIEQASRVVDLPRRKAQALLFYLAMTGERQQRATLATLLWPESDQQRAYGSLRRHLSELNLALGGTWIAADADTIGLARAGDLWVDVSEFQALLAACRNHDHAATAVCPACLEPLTAAVALYRADFLSGFTLPAAPAFDEWQFFQSEGLRQSYATALERLVQIHLTQAEAEAAIPYARQWLSLDPLHEPAHRQLMHLYAATGQLSAALRQYEICVQTLGNELDAPAAAETTALYDQLRRGGVNGVNRKLRREHGPDRVARHNLPAATTPFIGRRKELDAITDLWHDAARRLITILGPGGVGKTRLALEVAQVLLDSPTNPNSNACTEHSERIQNLKFADGVFFVPLA
jgi:DNA-binding SARP family transcriptional activator